MTSRKPENVTGTAASICAVVVDRFPLIPAVWGYNASPDHNNHRCVDYMINAKNLSPTQRKQLGDWITQWFIEMHNLGVLEIEFMVWRGRAWRPVARNGEPRGWGGYHDPGSHYDHVHVQVANGWHKPNLTLRKKVKRTVQGYWGPIRPRTSKGIKFRRKPGFVVTGTLRYLADGPYLVTRYNTWYPYLENFS